MRDEFTARVASLALVVAALATLGAVIYLSVRGQQVNEYLAGLAGLTVGAILPSPLLSSGATPLRPDQGRHRVSRSAELARGGAARHT
ncbi:MAG: hypothetical protein WB473_01815 [Pedococcus sp.]